MRLHLAGACLVLCLVAHVLPAFAQEPDYRADLAPIILGAKTHGGVLTLGPNIVIRIASDGPREALIITGLPLFAANEDGHPLASPCVTTYHYILGAEKENLSASAACPADALAISSQEKYDEMAVVMARRVFRALTQRLEELNVIIKERDA